MVWFRGEVALSSNSNAKGKAFEREVEVLLRGLVKRHPKQVELLVQPRLEVAKGPNLIPDFELRIKKPMATFYYLFEVRDRTKNDHDLFRKILSIKEFTPYNVVFHVYRDTLEEHVKKHLNEDGVDCMTLDELTGLLEMFNKELQVFTKKDYEQAGRPIIVRMHNPIRDAALTQDQVIAIAIKPDRIRSRLLIFMQIQTVLFMIFWLLMGPGVLFTDGFARELARKVVFVPIYLACLHYAAVALPFAWEFSQMVRMFRTEIRLTKDLPPLSALWLRVKHITYFFYGFARSKRPSAFKGVVLLFLFAFFLTWQTIYIATNKQQ